MSRRHETDVPVALLVCILSASGCGCVRLETSVVDAGSALFVRQSQSVADQQDVVAGGTSQVAFVPLMRPAALTHVRASFGQFTSTAPVPASALHKAVGASERHNPGIVLSEVEVSAHVIAQAVVADRPVAQVLFHAALRPSTSDARQPSVASAAGVEATFCATARLLHSDGQRRLTSPACSVTVRSVVCLASVGLPPAWWHPQRSDTVQVHFDVRQANGSSTCDDRESLDSAIVASLGQFLGTLSLTHSVLTYNELKEDRNVLVYVPQGSFYPGSRFRVPVKLQVHSELHQFIVKLKARHGVKIIGAKATNSSLWQITLDLSHKLHGAVVTATIVDTHSTHFPSDRIEDMFEWILEVDEDALGEDRGRIQIIVEYEMNLPSPSSSPRQQQHQQSASRRGRRHRQRSTSSSKDSTLSQSSAYRSVENRITAHVDIQRDNTYAIVPVVKCTELVNVAMLTGRTQTHAMRVYAVSHSGRLSDVTSQTTCHSGDDHALKVVESCGWVYMDGSETHGSSSVTVITKYGRHTRFTFFEVWAPHVPVDVVLSDTVLEQVKGWKVPVRPESSSRKARGAEFGLLTHAGHLLEDDAVAHGDDQSSSGGGGGGGGCETRYQTSVVDVYATFSVSDTPHSRYLVRHGAYLRVTDLVRSELRVANPSLATFTDGNLAVEGLHPGQTQVQVMSRSGRVVGSCELLVVAERVDVERLVVQVVSGVSLSFAGTSAELPRTLIANITLHSQLTRKYQEALLSISVKYTDSTTVPLHYISSTDYHLDVDTLNNHVVAFGDAFSPDSPRVLAVGAGSGELLKVSLQPAESCRRRKSRPLTVTYAEVDIDFTPSTDVQSDAAMSSLAARDSRRRLRPVSTDRDAKRNRKPALHLSLSETDGRKLHSSTGDGGVQTALAVKRKEVRNRHVGRATSNVPSHMSALEISMYTLLGVFCVAVVVFSVNCAIFVARFRQRKKALRAAGAGIYDGGLDDKDDAENCAPDWVWIGRETLERNAINTACSEALMSEADFNGNHTPPSPVAVVRRHGAGATSSNRNSYVSTYKGSECSVQISSAAAAAASADFNANVMSDDSAWTTRVTRGVQTLPRSAHASKTSSTYHAGAGGSLTRPVSRPKPTVVDKQLSAESSVDDDDDDETSSLDSRHRQLTSRASSRPRSRVEALRRLEEAVVSGSSDIEWDCNDLGVTYDQLASYFDNLKESTA